METITLSKNQYKKLQREQKYLRSEVSELRKIVQKVIIEELNPNVAKRLLQRSLRIDKGGGLRFSSNADLREYLRKI